MKNIRKYSVVFLILMITASAAYSQTEDIDSGTKLPEVKNILKFAPFQFFDNTFFLSYEGFNSDLTKSFNLGLGFKTVSNFDNEETGFKYEAQYRLYLNGFNGYTPAKSGSTYRRGIYASIFLSGLHTQINSPFSTFDQVGNFTRFDENTQTINAFNPGVTLGIQRSIWEILYIDIYVGGGVRFASVKNSNDLFPEDRFAFASIYDEDYQGVFPKIGMNIGIGF